MSRPPIAPEVLAAIAERAPKRLVRKLDKDPTLADAWTWGEGTVETDKGETVTLTTPVDHVDAVSCSCLLAPRCLHVLAVARALPLAEGEAPQAEDEAPDATADEPEGPTEAQRAAAARAFAVAARILDNGADATGTLLQTELLRAMHQARAVGMPGVGAAGMRVVQGIRQLHGHESSFRLDALAGALAALLRNADEVSTEGGRRRYAPIGSLRLFGVLSEPVVTASGYAGVTTWLADAEGRLFTVNDVVPGEPARARAAYKAGVRLGDVSIPHRALSRSGLFLQDATASEDGRLGAGKGVRAVRGEPCPWDAEPLAALFERDVDEQLDEVYGGEGRDLVFLRASVLGASRSDLVLLTSDQRPLLARAAIRHETSPWRANLEQLAKAREQELRVVARIDRQAPRVIVPLAVAPVEAWSLPEAWLGRINLGLDALAGRHRPSVDAETLELTVAAPETPDPLVDLRRRLLRMVRGGRDSIPASALGEVAREAALLERRLMPGAARCLRALAVVATERERTLTGQRAAADPLQLARLWLATRRYERAVDRARSRASW